MKFSVSRSARRDSRLVCGGPRHLKALKKAAHKRNRRARRIAVRLGRDPETVEIRVTGWDIV